MASGSELEQVTVALDWTPNTNHVGFYVAQALGYYAEVGISVELLSPHSDSYETTPASRVATQSASKSLSTLFTLGCRLGRVLRSGMDIPL